MHMDIYSLSLLLNLSKALLLTIVIELVVLLILNVKDKKTFLASVIINVFTNVSLNLIIQIIPATYYHIVVIGLEIIIVIVEYYFYYLLLRNAKQAIKIALFCNLASYLTGLILMPFIYWGGKIEKVFISDYDVGYCRFYGRML